MGSKDLGSQLYQEWKKICQENHAISQEYIKLGFWQSLNFTYMRDLNTRREVAHQKWLLLWDLLVKNDLVTVKTGITLTPSNLDYLPSEG
jgi:hypothetical protein